MYNIISGDVFDIGQTVNGCSKFIFIDNQWYYYFVSQVNYFSPEEYVKYRYGYNQDELYDTIQNYSGLEDITFIKNIFIENRKNVLNKILDGE